MPRAESGANARARQSGWLLVAAAVVAYRELLIEAVERITQSDLARLIFVPGEDTILVGLFVACLLVWRRRDAFSDDPTSANDPQAERPSMRPGWAIPGLGFALLVLGWSGFVARPDLSLVSLALGLPSAAALCTGAAGVRAMFLPALVLLLSIPLPAPVESESVWALQRATASATSASLDLLGFDATLEGIRILRNRLAFDVTESCSGLRLVQILVPLSIAIGDTARLREGRLFAFAVFGASLALFANMSRLVFEAVRLAPADPAAASNLGWQGLGLIALALGVLALAARLFRQPPRRAPSDSARENNPPDPGPAAAVSSQATGRLLIAAASVAVFISIATAFVKRDDAHVDAARLPTPTLARSLDVWVAQDLPPDYLFPYSTSNRLTLLRNYYPSERMPGVAPGTIEVFVTYEARDQGGPDRIPRSKLPLPAANWEITQHTAPRTDLLETQTLAVTELARNDGSEHALAYTWRIRDRGFARESLRSFLGLERTPDGAGRPRAVVRLATSMSAGLRSDRRRATILLDRFVRDFRHEFEAL